jgi:hypothetical protein
MLSWDNETNLLLFSFSFLVTMKPIFLPTQKAKMMKKIKQSAIVFITVSSTVNWATQIALLHITPALLYNKKSCNNTGGEHK